MSFCLFLKKLLFPAKTGKTLLLALIGNYGQHRLAIRPISKKTADVPPN